MKCMVFVDVPKLRGSLSVRRAWIEISIVTTSDPPCRSLSVRRAWIEMVPLVEWAAEESVALREESED